MAEPIPFSDHRISLDEAVDITRRYRAATTDARPAPTFIFHRRAYDRILRQLGCTGVRMYPALHDDGRQTVVLAGVDEKGNDMLDELAQVPWECPPICDPASPLLGAQ